MIADPRRRLVVAGCLATALFAAMPQSHAHAATVDVSSATVTNGHVQLVLRTVGLPAGEKPTSVVVRVAGAPVTATVASTPASSEPRRTVMLVVDTSGSMAGAPLVAARAAALTFLSRLVPDVEVGLVAFADRPHLVVAPTVDRAALRRGLTSLRAGGETTLYDGIALALHVAGHDAARQIVVLSDGADTRSGTKLRALEAGLASDGAVLHAIGFRTSAAQRSVLAALARAGKGEVSSVATVADLASAFAAAAQPIEHLVVTAALPASAAGHDVVVQVQVLGSDRGIGASVQKTVWVPAAPVNAAAEPAKASPAPSATGLLLAGFLALAGGLFLLVVAGFGWARPAAQARRRGRLLAGYGLRAPSSAASGPQRMTATVAHTVLGKAERIIARNGDKPEAVLRLDQAGLSLTPASWLAMRVGFALLSSTIALLMTKSPLAVLLVAPVAGHVLPRMWLGRRIRKRREKFIARLPDALQLVASSLSAGYSLPQALDALVQQGVQPVSDEIGRALSETRLGVPVEDALDHVAARVADRDFEWTVMAIRIQREVGGNLAEVLTTVGHTLRERASLRRQVKVLSAEGRLSAIILMALPILLSLFEFAFRRAYMRPLYSSKVGIGMLVFAIAALCAGGAWMRTIVKVEA